MGTLANAIPSTEVSIPRSLSRLQSILQHVQVNRKSDNDASAEQLSIVSGPIDAPLLNLTLGELLTLQSLQYHDHECLVCPWTGARWTYGYLEEESHRLALGLLALGVQKGDRIGVMAGNCEQYVSLFFGAAKVGAILVVVNNTYTTSEVLYALEHTECKLFFAVPTIGRHSVAEALDLLDPSLKHERVLPLLEHVIILRGKYRDYFTYGDVVEEGHTLPPWALRAREELVKPGDVCNLQFTSGSTGNPKAAMLTHFNIVNNARFIGDRMNFSSTDVLCCPPPLFHCFGLVLGLLAVVTHGAKIVYPGDVFDPSAVLRSISEERCTALHGVPTMFEAILSLPRPANFDCSYLRTGIIAGAPVPRPLMRRLLSELNMTEFTSSYGLTEASPTCFNAFTTDSIDTRLKTVGKVLPHARAKIIDPHNGSILPVGQRGELCMAGYQIFRGYWQNPTKTEDTMLRDPDGTVWLRTGDEAVFDRNGYCSITGRYKDIIIRGGENIYPLEIEERLTAHPAIARAAVIGLPDHHYGEVVATFIALEEGVSRPKDEEIWQWIWERLGRHKAPKHVFVLGVDADVPSQMPQTGSGKVQKQVLRDLGKKLLEQKGVASPHILR